MLLHYGETWLKFWQGFRTPNLKKRQVFHLFAAIWNKQWPK